jgi:hypothetical protein
MHVEVMVRVTENLVDRMLGYRGLIQDQFPRDNLAQHVIVLHTGKIKGHDQIGRGFTLDLLPFYLRERDPEFFLADPHLAAFAVLGRGDEQQRAVAFAESLQVIGGAGGTLMEGRLESAKTLANLWLSESTIERLVKEAEMLREELMMPQWERLYEETREEYEKGRGDLLLVLLRDAFGDRPDLPGVARELARWPDSSMAVHAITNATTLADVLGSRAPGNR